MKMSKMMVAALAAALLMLGVATAQTARTLTAKPTAVAVVELGRMLESLKERTAMQAEREASGEQIKAEAQQRQNAVQQLRSDLDMLTPGTPAYEAKQKELSRAALEYQVWTQFEQQQMASRVGTEFEKLYRDAMDTINAVAKEAGYDLVLFEEGPVQFRYQNLEQLQAQMQVRKVLYASDAIDITDEVVRRMNASFDAR